MNENLVSFLYFLMRDVCATGEVARIVKELEKCEDKEKIYTAKGLENYSRELAERILR